MRPMRLGLLAALIVAVMAPTAAMAQRLPKSGGGEAPPAKVTAAARKQGMAEAPALASASGVPCQVTDARLVGRVAADKKTGSLGSSLYEVACQGGMGYLLQSGQVVASGPIETLRDNNLMRELYLGDGHGGRPVKAKAGDLQ